MADTARTCGETVHETIDDVRALFRFRAALSLVAIGIFGGIGFIGIFASVNQVDGHMAVFIGGVAACTCAFNMLTNWGAADGHSRLAQLAARGHERLCEILNGRLDGIEEIERQTGNAVVYALDEVRRKRQGI